MTSYINSAPQYGSITIGAGSTAGTAAISAVGTNAVVFFGGNTGTINAAPSNDAAYLTLNSNVQVGATRNSGSSGSVTIPFVVYDFSSSAINTTPQIGTVNVNGVTSATGVISSVTTANAAIAYLGNSCDQTTSTLAQDWGAVQITSAIQITGLKKSASQNITIGFAVMDFQAAMLNSATQQFDKSWTSSAATTTQTISSVTTPNSICIFGGAYSAGTVTKDFFQYGQIASATTVGITIGAASTVACDFFGTVVEFISGAISQASQVGTVNVAGGTSATATITAVDLTKALLNFNGYVDGASSTSLRSSLLRETLTNATTVAGNVNTAGTSNVIAFECISFVSGVTENIEWDVQRTNKVYPDNLIFPQKNLWTPDNSPQQLQRTVEWVLNPNKVYPAEVYPQQKKLWTPDNSPQQLQRTVEWMLITHKIYSDEVYPQQKTLWMPGDSPQQGPQTIEWMLKPHGMYVDIAPIPNRTPWAPGSSPQQGPQTVEWILRRAPVANAEPLVKNIAQWLAAFTVASEDIGIEWLVRKIPAVDQPGTIANATRWMDAFSSTPAPPPGSTIHNSLRIGLNFWGR